VNPDSEQKRIAFGYFREGKHSIILHEGQAAAVKLIFEYYSEGRSMAFIQETFENIGIPSPLNNKKWNKQAIANILSNSHYLGDETYPTIISKEQFELAQKMKKDNIGNNGYTKKKKDNNFDSNQATTASAIKAASD
jgi:site-specific DNA recombinase